MALQFLAMKHIKQIVVLLLLLLVPTTPILAEEYKVVFHLNDMAKLPNLEKGVINLKNSLGDGVDIQVVINGRVVTSMLSGNRLVEEKVQSMLGNGASVGLCHNAIKTHNVNTNLLIEGVSVLSMGGYVTILELQKKGYVYIKI